MTEQDQEREAAIAAAAALGLILPEATIAGVVANRALLDQHLANVRAGLVNEERS